MDLHDSSTCEAIYTIGHGNRTASDFSSLLQSSKVGCLVDVRAFPGSRRHPHFGRTKLELSLSEAGIQYVWEGASLGGRRRPHPDSPHVAMRHPSFRAYADHMETEEFISGIERLVQRAASERTTIMCAERLPWQCHRYMISDFLVSRGIEVRHLIDTGAPRHHVLRAEARIAEGRVLYDVGAQTGLNLGEAESSPLTGSTPYGSVT